MKTNSSQDRISFLLNRKQIHTRLFVFISIVSFAYGCRSNVRNQAIPNHLDIYTTKQNEGKFCYILWTSDSIKSNPNSKNRNYLLDSNNVVYIHRQFLLHSDSVRIFNSQGENVSNRMLDIMRDDRNSILQFYFPTDEEFREHPYWDTYYSKKEPALPGDSIIKLKGYVLENP